MRVLVSGGGIAGLVVAIALGQAGHEVVVVERRASWPTAGAGIHLYANALRALDEVGVATAIVDRGCGFDRYSYLDSTGTHRVCVRYPRLAGDHLPALATVSRVDLHGVLVAAADDLSEVRMGTTVTDHLDDGDQIEVTLSDGAELQVDLVVVAEGIRSQLRDRVLGPVEPTHTGQGIWRSLVPRLREPSEPTIMFAGGGRMFGMVPINGASAYLLMGRPEQPDVRYEPTTFLDEVKGDFGDFGRPANDYLQALDEQSSIIFTAIEQVEVTGVWHRGRVVAIGDAVHATTPYLAQGAAMAIEDAIVLAALADVVPRDIGSALEKRRRDRVDHVRDASLRLNHDRYQGGSYAPLPDGSMSPRMAALDVGAQRRIDDLYDHLATPI